MPIQFSDNFQVNAPKDFNNKTGRFTQGAWRPFNSVTEAQLIVVLGARYIGLTQLILDNGVPTEYWYRDGIADSNLIIKTPQLPPTEVPNLQNVTNQGSTTTLPITAAQATLDAHLATLGQVKTLISEIPTQPTPDLQQVTDTGNVTTNTLGVANAVLDTEAATLGQVKGLLVTKADISGQIFTGNISAPNLSGTNTGDQDLSAYELLSNKQNNLTASATKYPTVNAVNSGLALKQDLLGFTPENIANKVGNLSSPNANTYIHTLGLSSLLAEKVNVTTPVNGGYGITVGGDLSAGLNIELDTSIIDNRYIRKDVNDNNGSFGLTLGSLTSGNAMLNGTVTIPSLSVGTSDEILVVNGSGLVQKKTLVIAGNFGVANAAGANQFTVPLGTNLRFAAANDASVSFDPITNTITYSAVPGSGGGGGVVSWNTRVGAVVPLNGDYNTSMVPEMTNLYFTPIRVLSVALTGFVPNNAVITDTDTVIQGFNKAQGQLNAKANQATTLTINGTAGRLIISGATQSLAANRTWTADLATIGTAGTYFKTTTDAYGRVIAGTNPTTLSEFGITNAYTKTESDGKYYLQTNPAGYITASSLPDLSGYVTLTTNQTISGLKSFVSPDGTAGINGSQSEAPIYIKGGRGGDTTATTGIGVAGNAKILRIESGSGGYATTVNSGTNVGGRGGDIRLVAGDGGLANGAPNNISGAGGTVEVQGGDAWGNGLSGFVALKGGNSRGSLTRGGNVFITPGYGNDTDTDASAYNGAIFMAASPDGVHIRGRIVMGTFTDDGTTRLQVEGKAKVSLAPTNPTDVVRLTDLGLYALKTTIISAGTGLIGGGDLSTNRSFSVSYGTIAGSSAQGNDSRINNGQTAFGWGNHAGLYLPLIGGGSVIGGVTINGVTKFKPTTVSIFDSNSISIGKSSATWPQIDGFGTGIRSFTLGTEILPSGYQLELDKGGWKASGNTLTTGTMTASGLSINGNASVTGALNANASSAIKLATARAINGVLFDGTTDVSIPVGTGTVTSIGLTVPTGFAASNTPITTNGLLGLNFDIGYSLPTSASQSDWNTAFGWGNHAGLYAPLNHVGSGGGAHSAVTPTTNGFMTSLDKTKLDGLSTGGSYILKSGDTMNGPFTVNGSTTIQSGLTSLIFGISGTSLTNGRGISLQNGLVDGMPSAGISYSGTATFGTHGSVLGNTATYITAPSAGGNRGWIFKSVATTGDATGNVASISATGDATFNGAVTAPNFNGNATTASMLQTARTINGVGFNGSANITIPVGTGTVTSVASTIGGNALNVTGTPITTSGTLAYAWAGTAGQYVNGQGNLVTFPAIPAGTVTNVTSANSNITVATGTTTPVLTLASSITSNAASATVLQTARTIWGQSFNGSANVSGALTGVTDVTATGTIIVRAGFNDLILKGSDGITFKNTNSSAFGELLINQASNADQREVLKVDSFGRIIASAGRLSTATQSAFMVAAGATNYGVLLTSSRPNTSSDWVGTLQLNKINGTTGAVKSDVELKLPAVDGSYDVLLPSGSGTLALLTDIPSTTNFVNTTGNQTGIAGDKSWTGIHNWGAGTITMYQSQLQVFGTGVGAGAVVMEPNSITFSQGTGIQGILRGPTSGNGHFVNLPNISGVLTAISTSTAPTTSTSSGQKGTIIVSGGFMYVCIATNSWVRSAAATF